MRVVVVDTGFANYHSVVKALEVAGREQSSLSVQRTRDPDEVRAADKLVMPGQGGFKDCAAAFRGGLGEAVAERIRTGTPFFGICLGLQVLFEFSEEAPGVPGLGIFQGTVERLRLEAGLKIPHMGWNQLEPGEAREAGRFGDDALGHWFYFDHSYHAAPSDASLIASTVRYGSSRITAAIGSNNVFATQFHPEKSQQAGLRLLADFLRI